jgi:endoglucanase
MSGIGISLWNSDSLAVSGQTPSYSPEATALFARMNPEPDISRKEIINTLISQLIEYGIWSQIDILQIAGKGQHNSTRNWVQDAYNGTPVGVVDFVDDKGFKGDGATFYIETGFIPTVDSKIKQDSSLLGGVIQDPDGVDSKTRYIGGVDRGSNSSAGDLMLRLQASTTNQGGCRLLTRASQVFTATVEACHLYLNRTILSQYNVRKNGNIIASMTGSDHGAAPLWDGISLVFMAWKRTSGAVDNFSLHRQSCSIVGGGLTDQQASDLYYSVNEYLSAIGAEERKFRPSSNAALSMTPANIAQGNMVTYKIVQQDGLHSGSMDVEVSGDLSDANFNKTFVQAIQDAVAVTPGVAFDGVKRLTFIEEFTGTLTWSRQFNAVISDTRSHIVRIQNSSNVALWKPYSASLVSAPAPVTHGRMFGWNNSGFDFNPTLPPSMWTYGFAASKGFNCFRIPYKIERVQPVNFGEINGADADLYKTHVETALSFGGYVVIDPHNYAAKKIGGVDRRIGTPEFSVEAYVDHIVKMNAFLGNNSRIIWCLMNEPVGLPQRLWWNAAQCALDALRVAGFYGDVQVPGTGYTGAHSWVGSGNAAFALQITDPVNNYSFDVHQYFDNDNSGAAGVCGVDSQNRLNSATTWATANGKKLFLGETGAGNPEIPANANCASVLPSALSIVANNTCWVGATGWGYGDRWSLDYHFRALQINTATEPDTWFMDTMENALSAVIG